MKKIYIVIISILMITTLTACKPGSVTDENVIYVTNYPVQYLVQNIAGDTVTVLRVPGSSNGGHSDELYWTGKEIIEMLKSDLLFYVDGGFDTYIPNAVNSVFSDGDVKLINLSEYITYNQVCYSHNHEDDETSMCEENLLSEDPHFWLDPQKMLDAAEVVKDQLIVMYPDNSELYNNNYVVLEAALEKLYDDFDESLSVATKPIITTNMLFNYWHSTFGIEILSLSTDAHNSEVVPGDVIEYVTDAVSHEIHYVLYEFNSNSPTGDLVLKQLLLQDPTAQKAYIYSLANLTQEQKDNGATYLTLMYENLEVLENAIK
jgi:zinc transport system substrate-binding protein